MMALLNEDSFLNMIKFAPGAKDPLLRFCSTFLERLRDLEESPDDQKFLDTSVGAPIKHMFARIRKMCRVICHFYCFDLDMCLDQTSDKEVIDFMSSRTNDLPERSLLRYFAEPDSFWDAEYKDMVGKGAGSILAEPKKAELLELLKQSNPDIIAIKNMTALMKELQAVIRSQRLAQISNLFKAGSVARIRNQ